MKYKAKAPAILLLEDGKIFYGKAAGYIGTATGEICFNTGMTGYQEVFTDPSYYGQVVTMTNVHIGNYGVNDDEVESDSIKIAGLICKQFNDVPSRQRSNGSLKDYFLRDKIVAISDVDTRALVRYIRDKGAMNCIISSETMDVEILKEKLSKVPSMAGLELSSKVSTKEPYFIGDPKAEYKIAVTDYGTKKNILRSLAERGSYLQVFPMKTSYEEMMKWNPDGFMISNGPGDPSAMKEEVATIKKIINSGVPTFGICLGHQLIAEASGISTFKMHKGHRGINHPVKNLLTGKCEITSQNHGFGVKAEDVSKNKDIQISHINLNDQTVEGLRYVNKNVFCVQYHPEACAGPFDSRYLFDQFISLISSSKLKEKNAKVTA
ncbi:MAG TPA: glutamine-hydrolyzing carbamoyl-phosphate synthase small subunit [Bacteroidia bacterium]|nr:glutamine-hydrolyzing carbamoyl-phosphate synthase small subunit [Bacteroidia bacterium]HRG52173.1 glutamine-hydrolyzing carbamoyl-phosphate synthase small subunit [Bacteroidia bacterium]